MPHTGPTVQNVSRLSAIVETNSEFATDKSGSIGSFTDIPFQEGSAQIQLMRETHDPGSAVQYQWDYREEVLGKKSATLSFTMPLAPTGTAAGNGVTAVQGPTGLLLSVAMGGEDLNEGDTLAASWSANSGTTTSGTLFDIGSAIGWINTNSVMECRGVGQHISTDMQVKVGFSAAPGGGDIGYASATYFLAEDPDTSLQFAVRGYEADDDWLLMGCQLDSMTLSLPLDGTIPSIQYSWKAADWLHGDDASGTFTNDGIATYSNHEPITGHAGRFLMKTNGQVGYTGSTVHVSAVSFEPQIAYQPVTSPAGTNTIYRWRAQRQAPAVQGSFTTFYEDTTFHDLRDNRTDVGMYYQIGVGAGAAILIEVPTAQVTDVQRVDDSGIAGVTVTFKGRQDSTSTSNTTAIRRSPFKIHLL